MISIDEDLTLRDYFAAAALQGFCSNPQSASARWDLLADMAYRAADAMLDERAKHP
jgi:hypothetical protein